jgi:hypothetical protein
MEIFASQGKPPESTSPVANLPPGVNDTGGKFATGVNDTGDHTYLDIFIESTTTLFTKNFMCVFI